MGFHVTTWRLEPCVSRQDTEMLNTQTTHLSLTRSGGKVIFGWWNSNRPITLTFFSSASTSRPWTPPPCTCWAAWPDGGRRLGQAGKLFLRTETHHKVVVFVLFLFVFFNYYDIKYHNENENHKPVAFFENLQKLRVMATPALLIRGQTESRTAAQRKAITRPPSASDQWTPSCCLPRSSGWSTHRCTLGKTTGGCQSAVLTGVGRQTKADRIE